MKKKLSLVASASTFLFASVVSAQEAPPPNPQDEVSREGFTLQLSLGGGAAHLFPDNGDSKTYGALGGMNLQLGAFVNRDFALTFKIAGVNYGVFTDDVDEGVVVSGGPSAQIWFGDNWNIELGAGLGLIASSAEVRTPAGTIGQESDSAGLGVMAGLNWMPITTKHHSFGLGLQVVPVFTGDGTAITEQLNFVWQFH